MTRRFADFSRPAPTPWTWVDTVLVGVVSIICTLAMLFIFVVCLLIRPAGARDLGQWEGSDPQISAWYRNLKQPDNPNMSCCGDADAYYADIAETDSDGDLVAVITDERPDEPLGRPHIAPGTKFKIPKNKIKWDQGNPTGHIVLFVGGGGVYCYVQSGGV